VGSLIGKAVEVDMEFTRERSIVRMLVDVMRPEFIPKTTVDHVYEGDGYDLLFKAKNGNGDVDDDTDMDEATSDDKNNKQDEHKRSDENNFDDAKNKYNSSSGVAEPKQPELSGSKNIVSVPAQVQFGTIDISPFMPLEGSLSEGKLKVFFPRKLWGDRDEEEILPSPPSEPNVGIHTLGGRNVWNADGPISYTAIEKSAIFEAAASSSPNLVCDSKSLSESMFLNTPIHANQHKVDVHDVIFLQAQEKIKECDKVHSISSVQVNSIFPSVSESKINDVSTFSSLYNKNCITHLSQQKVDMVEADFLQDNLTRSECELISCSPMLPQTGSCAASITPEGSIRGLSMSFQPEACAAASFLPGCAAAAACAPAATGLLPNIATAPAANTTVISAPLIIPGVYSSDINSNLTDMGHVNGNTNPLMSSGGAQKSEGIGVFLGGQYLME
jgi:hypothetical protein